MKFLSMWQEDNGKASFSRISTTIVLASWLAWVSFIVFNTKSLPGGMWEIGTLVGLLYGLNKAASAVAAIATASTATTMTSSSSVVTDTTKVS